MWAISGTSGSSGLGSVNSEQIDSSTCTTEHTVDPLTWQQKDPGRLIYRLKLIVRSILVLAYGSLSGVST